MQKTPVAVTALTMDQLEARSVKDLRDIGRFTPNVYMTNTGGQNPDTIAMFIRGVGLSDHLVTAHPGVGLYVDGVYYARAEGAVLDFVDSSNVTHETSRRSVQFVLLDTSSSLAVEM